MESIGRPRVALASVWLMGLVTAVVIVQGALFGAFYSEGEKGFIGAHGIEGDLTGYISIVVLIPLAFAARFPKELRIGWWTVLWVVVWNVQAHVFGYGIEDVRWFEIIHIPLALFILAFGLYLVTLGQRARRS